MANFLKSHKSTISLVREWIYSFSEKDVIRHLIVTGGAVDIIGSLIVLQNNPTLPTLEGFFIRNVSEECDLSNIGLTSLKGSPLHVGDHFYCHCNELESIRYSPEYVGGCFYCQDNKIKSLKGSPKHVGQDYDCSNNCLMSIDGVSEFIGGDLYAESNINKEDFIKPPGVKGKLLVNYYDQVC